MLKSIPQEWDEPRSLLHRVVGLIRADLDQIELQSKEGKLEPAPAADLVRYSKALLDIVKDLDTQKSGTQKSLQRLSDEELAALCNEMLQKDKA